MKKFLAFNLLVGIVWKPAIHLYWSEGILPRNRFEAILQFLHFANNAGFNPTYPNRERLYNIRPIAVYLVSRFQSVYTPEQKVSIDEEMLLWNGQLIYKQFIPNKRARFGI